MIQIKQIEQMVHTKVASARNDPLIDHEMGSELPDVSAPSIR